MNERIEAYLKQHYCRDYFNSYGEMVEDDHYFMYREEVDGLIELIVRECVQTLIDNTPERYTNESAEEDWDKGYDRAMKDCVHHIQEHFGVEA